MTDKIESDEVLPRDQVTAPESPTYVRSVTFALWVVGGLSGVSVLALISSFFADVEGLQTWALSQLSLILGAALGFVWKNGS